MDACAQRWRTELTHENDPLLSIAEEAAHWWVVCHGGNASPPQLRQFGEWVVRGHERVTAYLRIASVHAAATRPDLRWPATPAEELIRDALASPNDPVPLPSPRISRAYESTRRVVPRIAFALAASLLVAVLLSWFMPLRPQQFETKFGEQRSVLLADGSRVTLNTASKIEVRLEADRRVVKLVSGEALFEVVHDPKRPFDVQAGIASVRAVGTQFDIDRRPDRTVVTVVEGRVAMLDSKGPDSRFPVLSLGDRVIVHSDAESILEHGADVSAATAWTRGQLVVRGRPLGEVAEEFNRYNVGRIDIRSPALRAEAITASFQSNDPGSFIAFLETIPGVRVADDGKGGHIVTLDTPEGHE